MRAERALRPAPFTRSRLLQSTFVVLAFAVSNSPATAQTATSSNSVRTLLSWLDDAEVVPPRQADVSVAMSRVKTPSGHETDAPGLYAAMGVAPRVQFAASAFHYSSTYSDGFTSSGLGDVYVVGKVAVISPRAHPGGIAVSPLLEVLSDLSASTRGAGTGRIAWGLPVSFQYTTTKVQYLATTGYFSRGSVFAGTAVQAFVAQHFIATGSLLYSHATAVPPSSAQYGLSRNRTDVTGGLDYLASPTVTIYGTLGRTIGTRDSTSATSVVTIGLSVRIGRRTI